MVILYLVSPIVDPFNITLDTLKILLTDWGKYRDSVNLIVFPPCSFIITVTFISYSTF